MKKMQSILVILFFMLVLPILAFGNGNIYLVDDNNRTYYSDDNGTTVYYIGDNNITYYTDDNGTTLYYSDSNNTVYYADYNTTILYYIENNATYHVDSNGTVLYYMDENGTTYHLDNNGTVEYYIENNATYYVDSNGTILYYIDENGTEHYKEKQVYIEVPKGRSVISGNIDVTKLPSEIYAVWIVDGGNWYGYSPDTSVRDAIKSKYRLIDKIIPAYKAVIVWANSDASIEIEDDKSIDNVTQSYGKNFTIHGANNQTFSVDDVSCSDTNNSITGLFKVSGDVPSVFVPNREINSTENFTYIYSDEGYYVLCEEKQGGS